MTPEKGNRARRRMGSAGAGVGAGGDGAGVGGGGGSSVAQDLYRIVEPGFAEDVRSTSPLGALLMASEMHNMWSDHTDPRRPLVEDFYRGFLDHVTSVASPASLAMLRSLQWVAQDPALGAAAQEAARAMTVGAGGARPPAAGASPQPEPAWSRNLALFRPHRAWRRTDVYGDYVQFLFEFSLGRRRAALLLLIDTNLFGGGCISLSSAPGAAPVLRALEKLPDPRQEQLPVEPAEPTEAARRALDAIRVSDAMDLAEPQDDYWAYRAFALACLTRTFSAESGALSPGHPRPGPAADSTPAPAADPAICPASVLTTDPDTSQEHLVALVEREADAVAAAFIAETGTDEAACTHSPASDGPGEAASFRDLARHMARFSLEQDAGRVRRISPVKLHTLLDWYIPRYIAPDQRLAPHLPAFLPAWIQWCAAAQALPAEAVVRLLDIARDSIPPQARHPGTEPSSPNGPAAPTAPARSVGELFAEGLAGETPEDRQHHMQLRQIAMPYFGTTIGDADYPCLNGNVPAEMRLLVLGELPHLHEVPARAVPTPDDDGDAPVWEAAVREIVVNQLWHNDPPEAGDAAVRLLGRGCDREEVLAVLQGAVAPHIVPSRLDVIMEPADTNRAVDLAGYRATLATLGVARRKGGHLRGI